MSFFSESLITKVLGGLIVLSTTSYSAQAKPISQEKKEVLKQATSLKQKLALLLLTMMLKTIRVQLKMFI